MLQVKNIWKSYPGADKPAVKGVSLELKGGMILTLLGDSGCGKTTLLRLIAGLETPDQGEILIDGQLVADPSYCMPADKRGVGMVFQGGALFPHMTVRQNIAYGLSNLRKTEIQQLTGDQLDLIGLPDKAQRFPHELSGGEKQRVAVARALVQRPRIMLLDEPFSNLDTKLKARLREQIRAILKAKNTTTIMVSHDPADAEHFGDISADIQANNLPA